MRIKRAACLLAALLLLALLPLPVSAAGRIETDRPETLTILFEHNGTPVAGAPFSLYRVADVSASGTFTLTGDFKNDPVRLDGLDSSGWRALAATLEGLVLLDGRKPLDSGKTGQNGRLTFPNRQKTLLPGLYLLLGGSFVSGKYTYTVQPSLICLPCADDASNTWQYDALIEPKHTRDDIPGTPSDGTTDRKVLKVWDDGGAAARPQEITVHLLKNGAVYDTVRLNAKNNWRYTWSNLPKYDADGRLIVWRVTETAVDSYTVSIRQEGLTFVVTNTRKPGEPAQPGTPPTPSVPSKPPQLPQTGSVWWPRALLALAGLALLLAGWRCGKDRRDA